MTALEQRNLPRWKTAIMISVLPAALTLVLVKAAGGSQASDVLAIIAVIALTAVFAGTLLALWLEQREAQDDALPRGTQPSRVLVPTASAQGHLTRHRFYILIKEIANACRFQMDIAILQWGY